MSDERNEVELSPDQRTSLEEAARWEQEALLLVGQRYLASEAARVEFERASKELKEAELEARRGALQHKQILSMVAQVLDLPPGKWTFDLATGKLKKE